MTEALVVFDKVAKRFGDFTAVRAFDLEIVKGEFLAIMGPSGCGKNHHAPHAGGPGTVERRGDPPQTAGA